MFQTTARTNAATQTDIWQVCKCREPRKEGIIKPMLVAKPMKDGVLLFPMPPDSPITDRPGTSGSRGQETTRPETSRDPPRTAVAATLRGRRRPN